MSSTYTLGFGTSAGTATRSSDGFAVPWDLTNDCPADMGGAAGRTWVADGSPASLAATGPTPTVTGNQWAFALADLGLSSAWQVGIAKSKSKDQVRAGLIARDTLILAADPLLIRVAFNGGTADGTASGAPLIDVSAVFVRAQAMPL